MEDEKIIDQSQLAEDLAKKIAYEFSKDFLVKPLEPVMVQKQFDKPVVSDAAPKTDENGVEAVDYDKVETEVKEVESDFRKGVIIKIPFDYMQNMANKEYPAMPIKPGDILIYPSRACRWFDLLKDTQLVRSYDILGIEHTHLSEK